MDGIEDLRRRFAAELAESRPLRSKALVAALGKVPREHFLPPGPWLIPSPDGYTSTPDADPSHLYADVAIGIDPARLLNNGSPGLLCGIIDALEVAGGERVWHLGCGTGYYTAILAEMVGPSGRVTALELAPELHRMAQRNLKSYPQVDLLLEDALSHVPETADVILVNGGVTQPAPQWLDGLADGGRLALPLTGIRPQGRVAKLVRNHAGRVLEVRRMGDAFAARLGVGLGIQPLFGGRVKARERTIAQALQKGRLDRVRSLRRDTHDLGPDCGIHLGEFCLSFREPRSS